MLLFISLFVGSLVFCIVGLLGLMGTGGFYDS